MPRYKNAKELYESFTQYYAADCLDLGDCVRQRHMWPMPQGILCYALKIGYYSDKFDGVWREYTHAHGEEGLEGTDQTEYPAVIVQQDGTLPPWNPPFQHPKNGEIANLGYCLDIQVFAESPYDPPRHINFKDDAYIKRGDTSNLPRMGADHKHQCLVIVPRNHSWAILLASPIMEVTKYGILR